jgi:UPF0176 protein
MFRKRVKTLHNKVNRRELRRKLAQDTRQRNTLSFYAYTRLDDPVDFRNTFYADLSGLEVLGRIYVAHEGVNAQISVPFERLDELKAYLNTYPFLRGIRLNIAIEDDGKSFFALAIKVRKKIVADGLDDSAFDVTNRGKHLSADEFNRLTSDPETIVVDMRNHYESEVGHFEGAILPPMETFREGLPMVADMLQEKKDKPIVMYCTGGIRCEKASAYMKYRGFQNVFQLEGGIIEYARQVAAKGLPNKFLGKNFVFDERLGERISPEVIATCHQCGAPCDDHINCANDACHLLFIQCPECREKYNSCCSAECSDFMALPPEEQKEQRAHRVFNGMRFSKSRPGVLRARDAAGT